MCTFKKGNKDKSLIDTQNERQTYRCNDIAELVYPKSYGLGRDASKISIDMIDRYHSQQNLSDLEEFWVCSWSTSE